MAKQDVKTSDQQSKPATETAQGSQPAGITRKASASLPEPFDFFRMNPFSVMRRMADEMDRVFGAGAASGEDMFWSPAIEVSEGEGKYMVRAELAGLKPEDVTLEIENGTLTLQGERKSQHEEKKDDVHRTEIRYGRFFRRIPLPEGASVEQAHARFDNGVLEITVPVPQQKNQRRQIPIQKAAASSGTS